jgi:hypothetical protein
MTHTPGPWGFTAVDTINDNPAYWHIRDAHGGVVGDVQSTNPADTHLISAAPALLAVLRDLSDAYQKHFDAMPVAWQTYDDMASAAIARATYTLKD